MTKPDTTIDANSYLLAVDNSKLVAPFVPDYDDGNTFVYTEMLDRSSDGEFKLLKTFYHRSKEQFWEQVPVIIKACETSKVRACTRLSPRSLIAVGKTFTKLVVEAALDGRFKQMRSLYSKACGTTGPIHKVWIWDIDQIDERTELFYDFLTGVKDGHGQPPLIGTIPSRKGLHHLTRPFDARLAEEFMRTRLGIEGGLRPNGDLISLHKDNPTNLYIPAEAA